jgi:flagellar basal-body rod protein FlgC
LIEFYHVLHGKRERRANPSNFTELRNKVFRDRGSRVNQTNAFGGGTSATVTTTAPATVSSYEPTAPFADDNGMVAGPNVDLANELVQLLVARYTFAANAQVIRADAQMSASLLNITA